MSEEKLGKKNIEYNGREYNIGKRDEQMPPTTPSSSCTLADYSIGEAITRKKFLKMGVGYINNF